MRKHQWYSGNNNNWYESGSMSDIGVPQCVSCDQYIVSPDDNLKPSQINYYLCQKCIESVGTKMNSKVARVLKSKGAHKTSFATEHIPEYSVITAEYKNDSIITIGVDWGEVLVNDVIVENYDNDLLESNGITLEAIEGDLLDFIIRLGNAMYPDSFDQDALRAKDSKFTTLIRSRNKNKVVGWKSVAKNQYHKWQKNAYIPANTVFSPAEYYSTERDNSILEDKVLLKVCIDRQRIIKQRNGTIKLKKKLKMDCVVE